MAKLIPLVNGGEAIVDDSRYAELSQFKWYKSPQGYVQTFLRMHNLVAGAKFVDHKNRNKLDNRRRNLRASNASLNQRNRRLGKNNKSGFTGVYWAKRPQRWRVCVSRKFNGKQRELHLGFFDKKQEAARAMANYLRAERIYERTNHNGGRSYADQFRLEQTRARACSAGSVRVH